MKLNVKQLHLFNAGIPLKTIKKLDESELDLIHGKIISEQIVQTKTGTISVKKNETEMAKNLAKSGYNVRLEAEIADGSDKNNPWAICTSQMGKEFGTKDRSKWGKSQMKKYERCVKDVKKGIKEGTIPTERTPKENNKSEIQPKIKKADLLEYLTKFKI